MNILIRIDKLLIKLQEYILIFTSVGISLLIFSAAFVRYILESDFYGSEEIVMLLAFWLYFIGSALAERENSHISANMVNVFVKNERIKQFFAILKYTLSLAICLIVTYWSYEFIMRSFRLNPSTPVLRMPLVYTQIPVFISFALMNVYILLHLIQSITDATKKNRGEESC